MDPQVLDLNGRSFPFQDEDLALEVLASQGREEVPQWLLSLHQWLLEHQRRPQRSGDKEECRAEWRLRRAEREMKRNDLLEKSQKSLKILKECIDLSDMNDTLAPHLQDLRAWVQRNGRKPRQRSEDAEERKQSKRCTGLMKKKAKHGLSKEEQQLCDVLESMPRQWLQSLCAWVRCKGRRPRRSGESEEQTQAHRWQKASSYLQQNKLTQRETELFLSIASRERH